MSATPSQRLTRLDSYDDGVDRWEMARLRPHAALATQVTSYSDYWEETGSFSTRREMPGIDPVFIVNLGEPIEIIDGRGDAITVGRGEGFVAAAHVRHALSRSNGAQAGVHVHMPLMTLRRLLRVPLSELLDRTVPLDAAAGGWGRALCSAVAEAQTADDRADRLDRFLFQRLADAPQPDLVIGKAAATLSHAPDVSVEDIATDIGWSRKHLADRFRDATGLSPRMFRRLARFGRLTARLQGDTHQRWAEIAVDAGYFDQPHMLRDFRDFAGVTPREFIARSMPSMGGLVEG